MLLKYVPLILFSVCTLLAEEPLVSQSMLFEADLIAKRYQLEVAKAPSPSRLRRTDACLDAASIWFTIDLHEVAVSEGRSVFQMLGSEELWDYLREIGIQAVDLKGLKKGGVYRTGLGLDPRWGTEAEWNRIALNAERKGILLIGESIGSNTGMAADFYLALKNYGEYPGLYQMVEIPEADWKWLPKIATGHAMANIPWLKLQELNRKGYVPVGQDPYVKTSQWNATAKIAGVDGVLRRWIYRKENRTDPTIDWLDPSFTGIRLASADILDSFYRLKAKIFELDAEIGDNAKETLSLWVRKLGGFSAEQTTGGIASVKESPADLAFDSLTQGALLHALIAEDAEALRLIYRLLIEEEIESKRLVHVLQPFDRNACEWSEWISSSKKKFVYYDDQMTGDALKNRLLREDLAKVGGERIPLSTWTGYCASALGVQDFEKSAAKIAKAHLLLAFFYAMQPGAFSFSTADLMGALPSQTPCLDLMGPNSDTLYSCLPNQFKNCRSFALRMKQMLQVRRDHALEKGELAAVLPSKNRAVLLLLHRMHGTGFLQIQAINFGRTAAKEWIEMAPFRNTTAIDLMSGHFEEKSFESASFLLELSPLSGKVLLFQPKYY
jgi:maltose alpha-D-glucosyltransferase/alpha-amylase